MSLHVTAEDPGILETAHSMNVPLPICTAWDQAVLALSCSLSLGRLQCRSKLFMHRHFLQG